MKGVLGWSLWRTSSVLGWTDGSALGWIVSSCLLEVCVIDEPTKAVSDRRLVKRAGPKIGSP